MPKAALDGLAQQMPQQQDVIHIHSIILIAIGDSVCSVFVLALYFELIQAISIVDIADEGRSQDLRALNRDLSKAPIEVAYRSRRSSLETASWVPHSTWQGEELITKHRKELHEQTLTDGSDCPIMQEGYWTTA